MASLTKRKIRSKKHHGVVTSRKYYITWYERGRKRFKSTGKVIRAEADIIFKRWLADRNLMIGNISLREFITEILNYTKLNYRVSTYKIYRSTLNKFLDFVKDKPLKMVNFRDIESYKASRRNSISNTSLNIEIRTIKAAFNMAVNEYRYLEINPFRDVRQLEVTERELNIFSDWQINLLIANCNNTALYKSITIAVHSGMRLDEIINLKFKHLNFSSRTIKIINEATFKTKTGRTRIIYMADEIYNLFHSDNITTLFEPEQYVLKHKYNKSYITRKFINLCRKLEFPAELHFHNLRHTFASKLAETTDLNTLKEVLGHSRISTTEIYLHSNIEEKQKAIKTLKF